MVSGYRRELRVFLTRACKFICTCLGKKPLTLGHRMISYPNYKFTFPIKALGMFAKKHGNSEILRERSRT